MQLLAKRHTCAICSARFAEVVRNARIVEEGAKLLEGRTVCHRLPARVWVSGQPGGACLERSCSAVGARRVHLANRAGGQPRT